MDHYESIFDQYIQVSSGFLVVFALDNHESFLKAEQLITKINFQHLQNAPVVLIANKCDLDIRLVSQNDIDIMCQKFMITYRETSCKTGKNVKESFIK